MKDIFNQISRGLGGLGDKTASDGRTKTDAPAAPGGGLADVLGGLTQSAGGLGGLLGSAAIGGLLGTLLSGKTARKVAEGALVVGGTAAAGALAWKFYQKWSAGKGNAPGAASSVPASLPETAPVSGWPEALGTQEASPRTVDETALLLLEAMVFAARADGHIDDQERANIRNAVDAMFPGRDMAPIMERLLDKPLDPAALAVRVSSPEEARDLYRLSVMIIEPDHFMERSYLEGLASALGIGPEDKAALDREAAEAKA